MCEFSCRTLCPFSRIAYVVKETISGVFAGWVRTWVLVLLFAVASASAGEVINLAPGLSIAPPRALSLQYLESASDAGSVVLAGHIEGQPAYFMAADKMTVTARTSVLWEKLEIEIRERADRQSLDVDDRGVFLTNSGAKIRYRSYRYAMDGAVYRPVYYLIRQGESSYWITLTAAENIDLKVVRPIADAILKRAVISSDD